jgi:hypothetical protein
MKVRSLLAATLVAMLVPITASAAPKRAAASATPASPLDGITVGGFVGYEKDDVDGISLRFDGEMPFRALSPQVNLSWVGSIGYSRLSLEDVVDFNIIKVIPAARLSFAVNPQFTLFADGGLGFYYASFDTEVSRFAGFDPFTFQPVFVTEKVGDSEFSVLMRVGGGAFFQVNEKTRLGASIELSPYFGDFDQTTFLVQAGAMFRL